MCYCKTLALPVTSIAIHVTLNQKNGRTSLIMVLRNCRFKFFTDVQERAAYNSENKIKRINVIGRRHVELLMSKLILFVVRLSLCSMILNKMFT